jgi:arylsulfatase A-like enzyme
MIPSVSEAGSRLDRAPNHAKRTTTLLAILVVLSSLALSCTTEDSLDTRPIGDITDIESLGDRDDLNVLFILIDTLRADRLGSYGYHEPTSPTLDYLASTGVRFAEHFSQSSWTKSSMASLWTGPYPRRNGVTRFDDTLPEDVLMPAEILRDAGFRTTGIWRNGWVAPTFGFEQGFDIYQRPAARSKSPDLSRESPHLNLSPSDDDVVEEAVEFIRTRRNERWFLYLHLMDVHQFVYDEETALFGTDRPGIYANAIRREDAVVNRLFSELSREEQLTRTLVVVASDHGEAFLERNIEGHARHVYKETTEVPLIMSFPFKLDQVKVSATTRNVDVWPTLLDLLGLAPLIDPDGVSRAPEVLAAAGNQGPSLNATGRSDRAAETSLAHLDRTWGQPNSRSAPALSLVDDRFRLVYSEDENGGETIQLYDRIVDPQELRDVADANPEVSERMMSELRSYTASEPESWAAEARPVELDEMELRQLRALGYEIPQ